MKALALAILCTSLSVSAQPLISTGPTLPLLEVRPGNLHPISLAPGAGVQVSLTLPSLQRAFFGKAWDLLDVQGLAFGSSVSSASGTTFGALSLAAGVCTMSSLFCVGVGHDVVTSGALGGGWFGVFSFSFNLALAPTSPPTGIAGGAQGLPRANTLFMGSP